MTSVPVAYRMLAGLKKRQTGRSWRFIIAWSRARRPARSFSKLTSLRLGTRSWWMRGSMASSRPCSVITAADLLPLGAARLREQLERRGIAARVDQAAPRRKPGTVIVVAITRSIRRPKILDDGTGSGRARGGRGGLCWVRHRTGGRQPGPSGGARDAGSRRTERVVPPGGAHLFLPGPDRGSVRLPLVPRPRPVRRPQG